MKSLGKFFLLTSIVFGMVATPAVAIETNNPTTNAETFVNPELTRPNSFANLAQQLLPTVVNISSTGRVITNENPYGTPEQLAPDKPSSPFDEFFQDYMDHQSGSPNIDNASLGSGFIIDGSRGIIVTNHHVIADASDVRVTLHDDSSYDAKIIGSDQKTDLAILQIDTKGKTLPQTHYGDSDKLRVGDWILAIGNPFGLGSTVTAGIISARSRDINAGPYDDFIQTDASINRGNSGGPMFNTKGELIGINTAIFSPSGSSIGIGFAIPINMSKSVIEQLIETGEVKRGWLGVKVQSITPEIAESIGLPNDKGALVADIIADGPAAKSGLQPYDVLLEFNNHKINTMRDLPMIVAESKVNTPLNVKIFREGSVIDASVTLEVAEEKTEPSIETPTTNDGESLEENSATEPETMMYPINPQDITGDYIAKMNIKVSPITRDLSEIYGLIEGMNGLVITHVDPQSDALVKGLRPGDVILEVDREKIIDKPHIIEIINKAQSQKRTSLLLLVDRSGEEVFIALKLDVPKKKKKR